MKKNPIRTHREALELSVAELAAALGVSVGLIGLWERGRYVPPRRRQEQLARLLGVDEPRLASDLAQFRSQLIQSATEKLAVALVRRP